MGRNHKKRRRTEEDIADEDDEDLQLALALSLSLAESTSPREGDGDADKDETERHRHESQRDADWVPGSSSTPQPSRTPTTEDVHFHFIQSIKVGEVKDEALSVVETNASRSPLRRNLRQLPSRRQQEKETPPSSEPPKSNRKLRCIPTTPDDDEIVYDDDSEDLYRPQESGDNSSSEELVESDIDDGVRDDDSDYSEGARRRRPVRAARARKGRQTRVSRETAEETPVAAGSWSLLASELKDQYVDRQLSLLRESAGMKEAVREARQEMRREEGLEPQWMVPALGPKWSSKLNAGQLTALYTARRYMFGQIYHLGEAFRIEEKRRLKAKPQMILSVDLILNGHYVAAAVSYMRLPILSDDIKLMILSAHSSMRLDEATQSAKDAAKQIREKDRAVIFEQTFRDLMKQAKWPTDEVSLDDDKKGLNGAVEDARKHPAFLESAPHEYDLEFGWPEWCAVFDHARLRVEKSGKVW